MRPVIKLVKPSQEATSAVQQHMRATPYFTRHKVMEWFGQLDPVLGPVNAGRAADALLAELRLKNIIVKSPAGTGQWYWSRSNDEPATPPPVAQNDDQPVTDLPKNLPPFDAQMKALCDAQNYAFDAEFSWWPSIEHYIRRACEAVHHHNARWWKDLHTGEPLQRNVGECLMLIVSEVSEAMEGHRKGLMDDKLPHRPMLEVELADAVIRILDLAGGLNLDLAGAITEKMRFNTTRADHTREARLAPGGKA